MRFSVLLAAVAATLPVFAQEPLNETEYSVTDQSANFNMVVISPNATLNGSLLGACHDGAAFEGVCIIEGGGVANTENYGVFVVFLLPCPSKIPIARKKECAS